MGTCYISNIVKNNCQSRAHRESKKYIMHENYRWVRILMEPIITQLNAVKEATV